MKSKWKIIAPILIVAALAAAFFLQGEDETANSSAQTVIASAETEAAAENSADTKSAAGAGADGEMDASQNSGGDSNAAEEAVVEAGSFGAVSEMSDSEAVSDTASEEASGNAPAAEKAAEMANTDGNLAAEQQDQTESFAAESTEASKGSGTEGAASKTAGAENTDAGITSAEGAGNVMSTTESAPNTVTISISCATINDNLESLDSAKTSLVPADGWILTERVVEFNEGESVFNVLQRVCKQNKIHMEFMNTPVYNSAYIEGIGNLYEFDCGPLSGWMYSVNDWYPNYGCSRYELKAGDVICWCYTCDLGSDIGGGYLEGVQKDD